MASATEAELGGIFENCQETISIRTDLAEIGHPQQTTPVATDNTVANIIANGTAKQKTSRAIDILFNLFIEIIRQNHFHIFWEEGNKNLAN